MNGREWIVEAYGCDPVRLGDLAALRAMFDVIIAELSLHPVGEPLWHKFPAPGGVTGMTLLAESHLTVHTFPEHGSLCLNLFCCTPRNAWAWEERLHTHVGATQVHVRVVEREYADQHLAQTAPESAQATSSPFSKIATPEIATRNESSVA